MSSRSPRTHKSSTLTGGNHSPDYSRSPRSHSPTSHSHRSQTRRSQSPSPTHSPRSHSPKSHSSRITHSPRSPRSTTSSSSHHSPRSGSYVAKTSFTETTTTTTTKSPQQSRHTHEVIETHRSPHTRHRDEDTVVTEIRGDRLLPTSPRTRKAEVFVATRETWDYEGLQRLEEKIAVEKSALVDIKKTKADQKTLYNEALRTSEKRLADASKLERLVHERSAERDRLLEEEKELERRRAAIHSKAVEIENLRADLLAQAVLAKEEARVSQSLAVQRNEGVKQAKALEEGHKLAIQRLELHRSELRRKEVDVEVRGEAMPQPKDVQINVEVLPRDLPEAKIDSTAVSRSAEVKSHMHESVPHHSKTVLSPRSVRASEAHRQSTTVERHVISERDRVVS